MRQDVVDRLCWVQYKFSMRGSITSVALLNALFLCVGATWRSSVEQEPRPRRVLALFPHTGRSHQMVFEPLFRRLAERGHHVTVVSFFPQAEHPPTYRDISLVGLAEEFADIVDVNQFEVNFGDLEKILINYGGYKMIADLGINICRKFIEWPNVKGLLHSNDTYDVILLENFNSDCMLGFAQRFKAPMVALLSHNLMIWSADRIGVNDNPAFVPAMTTDFTDDMPFIERFVNTFYVFFYKQWFKSTIQATEQEIFDKYYGGKVTDIEKMSKNYSLMLVNTHHSLNGVRPLVPGLIEVGGMHLERPKKEIPQNIEKFLSDSKDGVILFSFGSLVKPHSMSKQKIDSFVKVFDRLPQRVILRVDKNIDNLNSDKILQLKWIPQHELLLHPKVKAFIGHGGLLGMTEAIDAGKPMLVIPFFGDQPTNAAAAQKAGLAVRLFFNKINEETLFSALEKVLSPQMRESAQLVSRVWHDRPASPLDTAVYWVERTARLGHLQKLTPHARDMRLYELALLDVAAAFLAILLAVVLSIYIIVKNLVYFIINLSSNKVKTN